MAHVGYSSLGNYVKRYFLTMGGAKSRRGLCISRLDASSSCTLLLNRHRAIFFPRQPYLKSSFNDDLGTPYRQLVTTLLVQNKPVGETERDRRRLLESLGSFWASGGTIPYKLLSVSLESAPPPLLERKFLLLRVQTLLLPQRVVVYSLITPGAGWVYLRMGPLWPTGGWSW